MAAYTVTEAETYYQHNMLPSDPWQSGAISEADKARALEHVTRRLEALPWREKYSTADARKVSAGIEAAFFALLVAVTAKWCPITDFPVPSVQVDASNLLNVLADLPRDVSARLLPYLDADFLTPRAQRSTADGRRAKPILVVV